MQNTTSPICEHFKVADETSKAHQDMAMTKNLVQSGSHHFIITGSILYFNVASPNSSPNVSAIKNGSEQVGNTHVNMVPLSYATKLRPTSSTMANLRKLEANVPSDADYDV
ncbi:hypothetical protein Tco_1338416 [Tanacetum coccineum]